MNGQKLKSNSLWRSVLAGLLVGTLSLVFGGCTKRDPVRVGLALELTGRQAELGVQERNGVQLAVEAINASGGVAGHPIELIIRDELGTPEGPKGVDRELIDAGVAAIVGHATSKQAKAALPVIDAAHVVLVSPTASSPELSGLSQYFFRVTISNLVRVHAFAQHIYQRRGITRIAAIYDNDNAAYAKVYAKTFADKYQSLGGKLVGESAFSSAAQPDFAPLLSQLRASDAQGLLIIASDVDAALIAQRTRLIGWQVPLFTSGWAQTEILINNGGHAVEGMELEQSFPLNRQSPTFLDFQARYQARFGRVPSFGAAYGYEAALVLAAALEKTGGKAEGLRNALLETRDFRGLIDTFSFDQHGDVVRPFYIGGVRDGKFVTVEIFNPTGS